MGSASQLITKGTRVELLICGLTGNEIDSGTSHSQACEVMIDVIAASPDSWQTEEVVTAATELRRRIHELWESVPDQFGLPQSV